MAKQSAYAQAGVDYTKIQPFKDAMVHAAKTTHHLPNPRGVWVVKDACLHGGTYDYRGPYPARFCQTTEGLGNKNWVAEWLYTVAKVGRSYYDWVAQCTARMATNDCLAQAALPVIYSDQVDASSSDWFADEVRAADFARGMQQACITAGMALVAGESPSTKYLVSPKAPVQSAPTLSGTVTGIIHPVERTITGKKLALGDVIIAMESSGAHANGFSWMIQEALKLPEQFLTKLPSGKMLGETMLTPTRCYVRAIEHLLNSQVDIHALLPGTGDGVAKLAFDKREFTYKVTNWPPLQEIFYFFYEILLRQYGMPQGLKELLKTLNCNAGYYVFVPQHHELRCLDVLDKAGYPAWRAGVVEEGKRGTFFSVEKGFGVWLDPPGQ